MLKIQELREIIEMIDQSDIQEFVYEFEGSKIKMKKGSAVAQVVQSVTQPMVQYASTPQVVTANAEAEAIDAQVNAEAMQSNEQLSDSSQLHKITSPMVGTFYQASSPDSEPYVKVGSKVQNDTIVCIVEAMKLFNEIEAEVEGEIVEVLVEDGQLVEYGQPLFLVKVG